MKVCNAIEQGNYAQIEACVCIVHHKNNVSISLIRSKFTSIVTKFSENNPRVVDLENKLLII